MGATTFIAIKDAILPKINANPMLMKEKVIVIRNLFFVFIFVLFRSKITIAKNKGNYLWVINAFQEIILRRIRLSDCGVTPM